MQSRPSTIGLNLRAFLTIVAPLALTLATGCGDDDGDACASADDCPAGSVCVSGVCIPEDAGRGCADNGDCGAGQVCARTASRTACVPAAAETICDESADLARACDVAREALGGTPTFCVGDRYVTCAESGGSCETCTDGCDLATGCDMERPDGGSDMGTGGDCMVDDDCATGVCEEGECVECRETSDCDEGVCGESNTCVACTVDGDCGGEGVCVGERCVECAVDGDCAGAFVCVANACVPDGDVDGGPDGGMDGGPGDGGGDDGGDVDGGGDDGGDRDAGPGCGNGELDPGEACDPPMSPSCDSAGCSATCEIIPMPAPACGDGCAQMGEQCGEPGITCAMGETCTGCRCTPPTCGNGTLDPGERCGEPGASCNAGQTCADCRCSPAVCGDGAIDGMETCGEPGAAACPMGQTCSTTTCTCEATAACGDGVAAMGEECGEPGLDACPAGSECASCVCRVTCGNGVADPTDECGEPGLTCAADADCNTATCRCVNRCGNGTIDPGETCDPPRPPSCAASTFCDGRCQEAARPPLCGNGCIDVGEECGEPGASPCALGIDCESCRCMVEPTPPGCGNGELDDGEQCDPPGGSCGMGEACDLGDCTCQPLVAGGRPFALIGAQSDTELVSVFESSAILPVAPDSAYTPITANSGVILVGDFVMVGINARGNLNTQATTGEPLILGFDASGGGVPVALPVMVPGYPNSSAGFAFRDSPLLPFREDVMTPGCLCEGWGVRFDDGGTPMAGDAALAGAELGDNAVPAFFGYFFDDLRRAWRVRTRATVGDLEITMDWSLRQTERYVPERIVLRNTGANALTSVRFARSLDYDIAVSRPGGMGFTDQFDFLYTPADAIPQLIRSRDLPLNDDYYGVATASPGLVCSDGTTFMQTDPDAFGSCNVDPADATGDLSSSFVFVPTIDGQPAGTLPAGVSVEL